MNRYVPIAAILVSLLIALFVLSLMVVVLGREPSTVVGSLLSGAFGSSYGLSETLVRTVPVLLCALAAAIPAESGQLNIGAEGQLHLGAIGAVFIAGSLAGHSNPLPFFMMVLAALVCGAGWAAFPAIFRAWLGVNEALVSLFLNYVALSLLQYLVQGPMRDPASQGWPMSAVVSESFALRTLSGTRLHSGILVAVLLALGAAAFVHLTRRGTELRAVGLNPTVSATTGIRVTRYLLVSMLIGGACAGLAGFYEVAGVQHRLRPDLSLGIGYSGFLVAWICRQNLTLLVPVSILVAGLIVGAESLQVSAGLPAAIGDVAQGLLLLFVVLSQPLLRRFEERRAIQMIRESELT